MLAEPDAAIGVGEGDAALVWFPAVGDTVSSFGRTALTLAGRLRGALRVLAFDPPGYASTEPIPAFSLLYDWAGALVDRIGQQHRVLVVAGNSSGADLALAAAVRSNARVAGCVFVCWPDWRHGRAPAGRDLCPRDEPALDLLLRSSWHEPPQLGREPKRRLLTRLADDGYRSHVDSFNPLEHARMLDQLGVPLTFLGGRSDGLVPPALLERSAAAHGAALSLVEEAGHYPQMERPVVLAEALTSVLRRWLEPYQLTA